MQEKEDVTKLTRWNCQECGKCCQSIVNVKGKSLSIVKDSKIMCRFFDPVLKHCTNYDKRPLVCRIYPFYIDMSDKSVFEAAKPKNLKIDKDCIGIGIGKKVIQNEKLITSLEDIAVQISKIERDARKKGMHLKHKM